MRGWWNGSSRCLAHNGPGFPAALLAVGRQGLLCSKGQLYHSTEKPLMQPLSQSNLKMVLSDANQSGLSMSSTNGVVVHSGANIGNLLVSIIFWRITFIIIIIIKTRYWLNVLLFQSYWTDLIIKAHFNGYFTDSSCSNVAVKSIFTLHIWH